MNHYQKRRTGGFSYNKNKPERTRCCDEWCFAKNRQYRGINQNGEIPAANWSKINKQLSPFEARLTVIEREGELRDEMIENYRRIQQNLQGEIEAIRRKIQELPITRPESTGKRLQAGALGMSAFQLPTLLGPSAPSLPRPTGLPRSQRRISGVAQLADMTDGKRCAFSADETRTLSREVSNNVHVGNKFVWKFTQVDDCLQKAKDGSNTHHYI